MATDTVTEATVATDTVMETATEATEVMDTVMETATDMAMATADMVTADMATADILRPAMVNKKINQLLLVLFEIN